MISRLANPLLIKELREEMRSRKIFFVVPVYIALLSIVALIAVASNTGTSFNPLTLSNDSRITMYSFIVTISILLGLVTVVLGASSFTTEREKSTFELLELTPLSYVELVLGKFLHGFVLICLILLSSMPVLATLFFMGGLTYTDLILSLFYLTTFFAAILMASICISIVSSRTILSIILTLALGFLISVGLAILTASASRAPELRGFLVISPWLVTYQQIFEPAGLKILGIDLPVWPFFLSIYMGLGLLFLCWGRNALDNRKLERNAWVRTLGIILLNAYAALGILCMKSFAPIKEPQIADLYQGILAIVVVVLPCFALGVFTDRDRIVFNERPFLESWNPARLMYNYPATGITYFMLLLFSLSILISVTSGIAFEKTWEFTLPALSWIFPWFLIFIALRLLRFRPRGIFVTYLLGSILYTIVIAFFNVNRSPKTLSDFYLIDPGILILWISSILLFSIAKVRSRPKTS